MCMQKNLLHEKKKKKRELYLGSLRILSLVYTFFLMSLSCGGRLSNCTRLFLSRIINEIVIIESVWSLYWSLTTLLLRQILKPFFFLRLKNCSLVNLESNFQNLKCILYYIIHMPNLVHL